MEQSLEIDGRRLLPIREILSEVSYSSDYITRLAREGKIFATMVGRQWFVDVVSLKSYENNSNLEQEIRKKHLSYERKLESDIRESVSKHEQKRIKKVSYLHKRAVTASVAVLSVGISFGFFTYNFIFPAYLSQNSEIGIETQKFTSNVVNFEKDLEFSQVYDEKVNLTDLGSRTDFQEIKSKNNGILLLPGGDYDNDMAAFFSDNVVIEEINGKYFVVKIDENGNKVRSETPHIIVPVVNN